jgi:hypothetical protein
VLAPAFQVVRRPVVQMVGSRHSSLSDPSTTVRATVASPWPCTAVTTPAGQATSHASTLGVTSNGTDHGGSGAVDERRISPPRSATLPVGGPASAGAGSLAGRTGSLANRNGSSANRVVSSTSSASGQAGAGWAVSTARMGRPL